MFVLTMNARVGLMRVNVKTSRNKCSRIAPRHATAVISTKVDIYKSRSCQPWNAHCLAQNHYWLLLSPGKKFGCFTLRSTCCCGRSSPQFLAFELAKRPADVAGYCLGCSFPRSANIRYSLFTLTWTGTRSPACWVGWGRNKSGGAPVWAIPVNWAT